MSVIYIKIFIPKMKQKSFEMQPALEVQNPQRNGGITNS